ncbi:MAG TPA: outer membrane protein [Methylovirgula sp.]|nr:outer membrane protein [Methylovirgula sp.]
MLKKLLVASVAAFGLMTGGVLAADLPNTKGPPVFAAPPPPPVFSWSGIYVGGQVGYEWGTDTTEELVTATGIPDGFNQGFRTNGVIGGGHVGFNYQVSQFVFGIEGDINGADNRGGYTLPNGNGTRSRQDFDAAILGRAGITFDRLLIYAQGGVAFGDFKYTYFTPAIGETINNNRVGWTVGAGIEYAIDPNWSVFADYRYTDFGVFTNTSLVAFPGFSYRQRPDESVVQGGFSYHFDIFAPPAPVVAKY